MTTILALDTATGPCSVALWKNGQVAAYLENTQMPVRQSACLLPMVEQALAQTNTSYHDLNTVAATVGPGSFTGIRIALAAAHGIAFAANVRETGFTTLEVLAYAARTEGQILSILTAGKGEYYYQYFETSPHWRPLSEPMLGTLEQAIEAAADEPATISGNAVISHPGFATSPITFPRADALAELAATQTASLALKPFYIRPPDAKLPTKKA